MKHSPLATSTTTRGGGAWCDGNRLAVRTLAEPGEQLVATGFNYEKDVRVLQSRAAAVMMPSVRDIRRLGSAALDLCWLGAGRIDAYVEEGLNEWDLAAGGLVAEEAGARVEVHPGVGGKDCVVGAPEAAFDAFAGLVRRSGFLRE